MAEIERLRLLIAGLLRNRFGRRSERFEDDQLDRGIEDLEQSLAEHQAGLDAAKKNFQPRGWGNFTKASQRIVPPRPSV